MTLEDICCCTDVFKPATCATCNDSLIDHELTVFDLVHQGVLYLITKAYLGALLNICKDVSGICVYFSYLINIAWMERHSDHRIKRIQINLYKAVIVSNLTGLKLLVIATSSVDVIELFYLLISLPD